MIEWVQKRDGRVVPFNAEKIADAIFSAAKAVGGEDRRQAEFLAGQVIHLLSQVTLSGGVPQVEQIQDLVEKVLIEHGHARTAKAYILYRNRRTRIRDQKSELMDAVSEVLQESDEDLPGPSTPLAKLQRIAVAASEQYTLNNLLPREFAAAHQRAAIHIEHLAYYSLAVSAVWVSPELLLRHGVRLRHTYLPPARQPADLLKLICQLALLMRDEVCGELLFADVDQVHSQLISDGAQTIGDAELVAELQRWLSELDVIWQRMSPSPLRICLSVGRDQAPAAQSWRRALLTALEEGLATGCTAFSPQVVYQIAGQDLDPSAQELLAKAKALAHRRGNPSLALAELPHGQSFASGLSLPAGEPGLIARVFVNLPRIALEAGQSSDFWAGIDAALSLATRQLVHRYEVLSALPVKDWPLLFGAGLWAGEGKPAEPRSSLLTGQLAVVPIGINEALQVAKLRFGGEIRMEEADLAELLQGILTHWRSHYALNLRLAQTAAEPAARRFLLQDQQAFPLAHSLWADRRCYRTGAVGQFPGGQYLTGALPPQLPPGAVWASSFQERRCPACGELLDSDHCRRQCAVVPVGVASSGGYLQPF